VTPRGKTESDRAFIHERTVQRRLAGEPRIELAQLLGEILHLGAGCPERSSPTESIALGHCLALEDVPVRVFVVVH
jgi:hypothetical protein